MFKGDLVKRKWVTLAQRRRTMQMSKNGFVEQGIVIAIRSADNEIELLADGKIIHARLTDWETIGEDTEKNHA